MRLLGEEPKVVAQYSDYAVAMIDGSINGVFFLKAVSIRNDPILHEMRIDNPKKPSQASGGLGCKQAGQSCSPPGQFIRIGQDRWWYYWRSWDHHVVDAHRRGSIWWYIAKPSRALGSTVARSSGLLSWD